MRRVRTIATNGTLDVDFDRAVPIRTILLTMTTLAAEVACVITQCAIEDSQFLQLFCLGTDSASAEVSPMLTVNFRGRAQYSSSVQQMKHGCGWLPCALGVHLCLD